jgi:serine protease inhibitor
MPRRQNRRRSHPGSTGPFLFAIVEQQTGAILFLGQITDPRR